MNIEEAYFNYLQNEVIELEEKIKKIKEYINTRYITINNKTSILLKDIIGKDIENILGDNENEET